MGIADDVRGISSGARKSATTSEADKAARRQSFETYTLALSSLVREIAEACGELKIHPDAGGLFRRHWTFETSGPIDVTICSDWTWYWGRAQHKVSEQKASEAWHRTTAYSPEFVRAHITTQLKQRYQPSRRTRS